MLPKSREEKVLAIANKSHVFVAPYLLALAEMGKPSSSGMYMIPRNLLLRGDPNNPANQDPDASPGDLVGYVNSHPMGVDVLAPISIFAIPRIWLSQDNVDTGMDVDIIAVVGSWLTNHIATVLQSGGDSKDVAVKMYELSSPDTDRDHWIDTYLTYVDMWSELHKPPKADSGGKNALVGDNKTDSKGGKSGDIEDTGSSEESKELQEVRAVKDSKNSGGRRRKPRS